MREALARLRAYAAVDDPLAGAAVTVALVVAGNQPFIRSICTPSPAGLPGRCG